MTLCDLKINQTAKIKTINHSHDIKRRLYDLGFVNGTLIKSLLKSPSNNIKAYYIRDSLIAIRNSDAKKIEVDVVNE